MNHISNRNECMDQHNKFVRSGACFHRLLSKRYLWYSVGFYNYTHTYTPTYTHIYVLRKLEWLTLLCLSDTKY